MKKLLSLFAVLFLASPLAMASSISNTKDINSYPLGNKDGVQYKNSQKCHINDISGLIDSIAIKFGENTGTPVGPMTLRIETSVNDDSSDKHASGILVGPNAMRIVDIKPGVNLITFDPPVVVSGTCIWLVTSVSNQESGNYYNQRVTAKDYEPGWFRRKANGVDWATVENTDEYFVVNYRP